MFRRGCSHERLAVSHFPYLWAAYRRGTLPEFPKGLNTEQFSALMLDDLVDLIQRHGDIEVLVANTRHGTIPVGLAMVTNSERHVEADWLWFNEASLRNKLECVAKFLVDLKKAKSVLIASSTENARFYSHLGKYGILRAIGVFRGYWEHGDAVLYQSVN